MAPETPPTGAAFARDLAVYTLGRLVLLALIAGLLVLAGLPLLVAVLLGILVALPLSLVLMRTRRARVSAGLKALTARRRAERERLRQQLHGERNQT